MDDGPNYGTVLVPTDGSETAATAVDHALGLAERFDAAAHAVYVVDTAGSGVADAAGTGVGGDAVMIQDSLEEQGRTVLERFEERADGAGVDAAETALLSGAPHRTILDYADEHDADLIVMGTHGRRGVERYLLGSVTEKVVRLADVPVLAVHGESEAGTAGEGGEGDR